LKYREVSHQDFVLHDEELQDSYTYHRMQQIIRESERADKKKSSKPVIEFDGTGALKMVGKVVEKLDPKKLKKG